jgi:site-specific DNA-methyltransferase (adenine-specific)
MLEQIGFAGAALAYEGPEGLTLIDGHARQELAADEEIPVLVLDLDEAEAKLLLATFDPLGAMAGTDSEALAALLAEVSVDQADLEAHLVTFLAGGRKAGKTGVDDLPEVAATRSASGALWALGEHRVLCADATDPTAWERLMAGATGDILWTDPPYGVGYQSKLSIDEAVARNRRQDGLDIANDQLEGPAFRAFLADALGHALSWMRPGAAVYVSVPTGPPMEDFMAVLNGADVFRQTLIWVKDVFVMGRHDYHYRHEGILYGWKPGAAHAFTGGRSQDTVWDVPRPKRSKEHPTMKPVELIAPALENSSLPGALVLDPFLGSAPP